MFIRNRPFEAACFRIENNPKFVAEIDNGCLLELYRRAIIVDGRRVSPMAIQASTIVPRDAEGEVSGKAYDVHMALRGPTEFDDYPVLHIDDSTVLHVAMNGEITVHDRQNAENNDFNHPSAHWAADDFLNVPSLLNRFVPRTLEPGMGEDYDSPKLG